jgi:hypothetical protein
MRTNSIIQLSAFLLLSVAATAQPNPLAYVQTRVDQDQSATFQEKIFAHTDKTFYLAGEILWVKLYCVDAATHKPLDLSKLAYVEVLGPDNKPALQGKIALDKGHGEGSFSLPPSIHTGNYRLRAYTNWMKNDGSRNFFEQPITIVNVFGGLPAGADSTDSLTHQPIPKAEPFHLALFPEGGDLVTGLRSTVAFEAADDQDRALTTTGFIADDHNDTVLSFHTLRNGMGTFAFTPAKGNTYHAVLPCPDGITRSWPLPTPKDQGFVLHLSAPENVQTLTLVVHTSQGRSLQDLHLFIRSAKHAAFSSQAPDITGDSVTFTVSRDSLTEGINRFTIFDDAGRPMAERAFFLPPHHRLLLTATTDQTSYSTRHKVQLSIASRSEDGNSLASDLSLAVYRLDSLQGYPSTDICQYLWLSSDWQGRIPHSLPGDQPDAAGTDLLMLTHGWTRFRWADILHPNGQGPSFAPEIRGQFITGRLTEPHTGAPGKSVITWLTAPGSVFQFASTITDSDGRFHFDVKDFYGSEGIVIHTPADQPIHYKIDLSNPFSEQYDPTPLAPFRLPPPYPSAAKASEPTSKDASEGRNSVAGRSSDEAKRGTTLSRSSQLLIEHSIGMQVQNVYTGDSLNRYRLPLIDTTPFYGKPDFTYHLDDYTRFTSMEEVLREYVREINVGHEHGHLHMIMINEPAHATFDDGKTLVLLDGIPVPADSIFNYDPQKVKRLDVIDREYILGPSRFSGIASYITYKGDYEGLELDANSLLIDYDGLQRHREFYAPAYTTDKQTQSRMPDFRNLLYWNPAIHTGEAAASAMQFYTSDLPGDYLVVVQGISPDGRAGVTYQHFTVTKQ